ESNHAAQQLNSLGLDDDYKPYFTKLSEQIANVRPRVQQLIANAKPNDDPATLYTAYLKDITIPFDQSATDCHEFISKRTNAVKAIITDQGSSQGRWLLISGILEVVLGLLIALWLARRISSLVDRAAGQVKRIAVGELNNATVEETEDRFVLMLPT